MNKDFFNKKISLKDIKDIKIDLKKIKNKKEIIISILILIYIICIILIGNHLLKQRELVKDEYDLKEAKYNALQNSISEEEFRKKILELENEKQELANKILPVESNMEVEKIFADFKAKAPITWGEPTVEFREIVGLEKYNIYSVDIESFSGTLKEVKDFLEYVDNYDRIVRIDSINFNKNKITGKIGGRVRLTFYFTKEST